MGPSLAALAQGRTLGSGRLGEPGRVGEEQPGLFLIEHVRQRVVGRGRFEPGGGVGA